MDTKNRFNAKKAKFKINNIIVTALFLSIVLAMNIFLELAEDKFPKLKTDLTQDAITKLTNETKVFLKALDETENEVDIIYLKGTSAVTEETDTVLKQYDAYSANTTYTVENYHKNPLVLEPFQIGASQVVDGTVVVTNKDKTRYRAVSPTEMWSGSEFLLESKVTNAIAYLMSDADISVCVAVGYENDENYVNIVQKMLDNNIDVKLVNLLENGIGKNVDVLMVLNPGRDLDAKELERIDNFILSGGSVVVSMPFGATRENLESYIASWGVKVNNDVIFEYDKNASYYDMGSTFYAQKGTSDITAGIEKNIVLTYARSMSFTKTGDVECTRVLSTSGESLATPPEAKNLTRDDIEAGPFDVAYLLERPVDNSWDRTGKLFVTSTSGIWGIEDALGALEEIKFGNSEFVMNTLTALSEKEVKSVTVPKKTATENIMDISDAQAKFLKILICVLLPICVLLLGVTVWIKRRNK